MQYVIGRRADGPVEFEAECSFAIISSLWHSLCLFQSDAPNGLIVKDIMPLAAAVAATASDAACIAGPSCFFRSLAAPGPRGLFINTNGCMHAAVICGTSRHYSNPLLPPEISLLFLTSTVLWSSCATHMAPRSIDIQPSAVKGLVAASKMHSFPSLFTPSSCPASPHSRAPTRMCLGP